MVDVPNDLTFLVDLRQRLNLRKRGLPGLAAEKKQVINGPRGLDVIGSKVYVAVYFSDAVAMVDMDSKLYDKVTVIPLGPEPELTLQRRGEMNFHDADICFQQWQSCASCHPDARIDGLNWDLLNDDIGTPKNVKSMLLSYKTPPAMSAARAHVGGRSHTLGHRADPVCRAPERGSGARVDRRVSQVARTRSQPAPGRTAS